MTEFSLDWPKLSSAHYSQSMAEMATTGITETAAGNIPGSAIRIEALQEILRHPSGTQGFIPLDRYIRNYDSAYHIIFTNVKAIRQFSSEWTRACRQRTTLLNWGMDRAFANMALRLLPG